MKILITGASGFIGKYVLHACLANGFDVAVISRSEPFEKNVTWIKGDLSDKASYEKLVILFSPETIIHLAWTGIPDFSSQQSSYNLTVSINFLELVMNLASCKKILISGSCFEYNKKSGECNEADLCSPKDYFTWAKLSLLNWAFLNGKMKSISVGWLRLFYVYGPGQRGASLIPTCLNKMSLNQPILLNNPYAENDFIYVQDVANAFICACFSNFEQEIFNIGSGVSISIAEIVDIASDLNCKPEYKAFKFDHFSSNHSESSKQKINFWASTKKSFAILNWFPKVNIKSGISFMIWGEN